VSETIIIHTVPILLLTKKIPGLFWDLQLLSTIKVISHDIPGPVKFRGKIQIQDFAQCVGSLYTIKTYKSVHPCLHTCIYWTTDKYGALHHLYHPKC